MTQICPAMAQYRHYYCGKQIFLRNKCSGNKVNFFFGLGFANGATRWLTCVGGQATTAVKYAQC